MSGIFDLRICIVCRTNKGNLNGSRCCEFKQLYCTDCVNKFLNLSYGDRCPGCNSRGWYPSVPFRFKSFSDYLNCLLYQWMNTVNRGSVSIRGLQPFYNWIVENNYMTPQYVALLKGKGKFLKIVESGDKDLNRSHFFRNGKIDLDLCLKNLHIFAYSYLYEQSRVLSFLRRENFTDLFANEPLEPLKNLLLEYFEEKGIDSLSSTRLGEFWHYVESNGIKTSVIQIMLKKKLCESLESLGFRIENRGHPQWILRLPN